MWANQKMSIYRLYNKSFYSCDISFYIVYLCFFTNQSYLLFFIIFSILERVLFIYCIQSTINPLPHMLYLEHCIISIK